MKQISKAILLAVLLAGLLLLCACNEQTASVSEPPAGSSEPAPTAEPAPASDTEQVEPEPPAPADWTGEAGELRYLCAEGFDYAEEFYNGYAFAVRGLDCGYVDKDGNFTISYQISEDTWDEWFGEWGNVSDLENRAEGRVSSYFGVSEEGLYPYCEHMTVEGYETDYWGYKNINSGEVVISAQYLYPTPFREGRAVVDEVEIGYSSSRSIIDTHGNTLYTIEKDWQGYFSGGMLHAGMGDDNMNCMVDRDGNVIISFYYNAEMGGADLYGNLVVSGGGCRNDLAWDPEHILAWDDNAGIFYINSRGRRTLETPAGTAGASAFRGGIAGYRNGDGLWGMINCYGEVLTPAVYEDFGGFGYNGDPAVLDENDYSWVREDGKYYIVDTRAGKVDGEAYEYLSVYSDGLMAAGRDGRYGYIRPGEGVVIDLVYDLAYGFKNGVGWVQKDGESFYIDKNGERLTGAYTDRYFSCEEDTWLAFHKGAEHPFNFVVRGNA